jgi:FtsZ-binding cell division protein ZapB
MHHSWQTSYWTAGILYDDSYSDEWKNYIKLDVEYIWKKNAKLKKEYENAKEKYEELKKKNSKVYNMLKRKFQIPKWQYARFNIIEEKEESKGILWKVKWLFK